MDTWKTQRVRSFCKENPWLLWLLHAIAIWLASVFIIMYLFHLSEASGVRIKVLANCDLLPCITDHQPPIGLQGNECRREGRICGMHESDQFQQIQFGILHTDQDGRDGKSSLTVSYLNGLERESFTEFGH